jgi:hypothetical protein
MSNGLGSQSTEAKNLISSILQLDPSRRISVEAILRHPWFSKTIIDPPLDSIPGAEGPITPFLFSPDAQTTSFFPEAQAEATRSAKRPGFERNESALSSSNASPALSPRKEGTISFIDTADSYIGPYGERHTSNKSDTSSERASTSSSEVHGSENATTSSTITTPSTPMMADGADSAFRVEEGSNLDDTPRAAETTQKLPYEHSNTSQSTIRKSEDDSRQTSVPLPSKSRVQVLAKQWEEDEEQLNGTSRRQSFVSFDEHSLHLPVAQHSRTPNRTKRRSVSSTLSERRPSMPRGYSNSVQAAPNIDYHAQLHEVAPPFFSTKEEENLLSLLRLVGVDVGQLQHSVNNNACDASSALWWMLRAKQKQELVEAELDSPLYSTNTQTTKGPVKVVSYDLPREKTVSESISSTPPKNVMGTFELGPPVLTPSRSPTQKSTTLDKREFSATTHRISSPLEAGRVSDERREQSPGKSLSLLTDGLASSSPRHDQQAILADIEALKPTESGAPASPSKKRDGNKNRSTSFNMLQRATSAFTTGNLAKKKSDEKLLEQIAATNKDGAERARSPNKLLKLPRNRENSGTEDSDAASSQAISVPSRKQASPPTLPSSTSYGTVDSLSTMASSAASQDEISVKGKDGKARKRESFLTTFRSWFIEDKKRKRAPPPPTPTLHVANNAHVNRRPPGYQPATSASSRRSGPLRRTPSDQRPAMHSRRSSSLNSRRSSVTSIHMGGLDLPVGSPLDVYGLMRRGSLSRRSAGSRTPTSERGDFFGNSSHSRPSSVHSFSGTVKSPIPRHIETASRSGSSITNLQSRSLHNRSPGVKHYQRVTSSSPAGRSRHARFATSSAAASVHLGRAASTASSHRSTASSRRSSGEYSASHAIDLAEDEADFRDDASVRSARRTRTGHERYVYPSSRRIRSPHGSSTSLATMPYVKPKPPIRDVFAKKKSHDGLTDDDWVSDDEDGGYAGGLGQCSSSSGKGNLDSGTNTWKPGGSGSGFDTVRSQDSPMMKGSSYISTASYRSRAGNVRLEPPNTNKTVDSTVRNASMPTQDRSRPIRSITGARPVQIIEEDEEGEEEG